ncbi:Cytochrome P450, putative [Theobroma cacao]|uniref:Cytochrome P450, putative n=1 Tax=Theobroma cacao TaxID=3641 RepID=A0A061DLZ8_THECC|nr:Cytochrome P450, putative [Theobroma cacao]
MADAVGKKSVLYAKQESHKRIRRLLSVPFSMDSLSTFVKKIDKMPIERLNKLEESGKSFSVLDFGMKMNFDAMCNMLMSVTDDSLLRQIEKDCIDVDRSVLAFPVLIPGTTYYRGMKARKRLMESFREMIARRRSGMETSEDFLHSILQRDSCAPNEELDDSEIIDNLITLLIAGKTTTASAIMWCVKFLDENREVQYRLREEQHAIARNKPEGTSLTLEDLKSMSYGLKETQKPYSFIPFGSGPRTCLGMNMAKVIMLVFLHRLITAYNWTVDDLDPSLEKKSHIPRLRSGCPITLKALNKAKQAWMT